MSITRFFTTDITIATPSESTSGTTVDAEGVPTTTATTATVKGAVQPYRALEGERVLGVELSTEAKRIWLPAGTTVTARSTLTIGGVPFNVVAGPDDWYVGSRNDHRDLIVDRIVR